MAEPYYPSAIGFRHRFHVNDSNAIAAVRAAQDLGLDVPRDLSVVGFDDLPFAAMTRPALTTIRQPPRSCSQNHPQAQLTEFDRWSHSSIRGTMSLAKLTDLSGSTKAPVLGCVKSLFAFAPKLGCLPFDVARVARLPEIKNRLAERIVSGAHVVRLFSSDEAFMGEGIERGNRLICITLQTGGS